MSRKKVSKPDVVVIDYASIGTVSIAELTQALWEDIQVLRDAYGAKFVTGAKLVFPVTNEYGEALTLKHPDGRPIHRMHTHRYRPACLDYNL